MRCSSAEKLQLRKFYSLSGIVTRGDQIGRKIGFPTANLFISESYKLIPSDGVYAIFIYLGLERFDGMLNIGWRPTVKGKKQTIEAHLFGFNTFFLSLLLACSFW